MQSLTAGRQHISRPNRPQPPKTSKNSTDKPSPANCTPQKYLFHLDKATVTVPTNQRSDGAGQGRPKSHTDHATLRIVHLWRRQPTLHPHETCHGQLLRSRSWPKKTITLPKHRKGRSQEVCGQEDEEPGLAVVGSSQGEELPTER